MKGKDLKQAKVHKVELDKIRPLTFDFNALCELQEFYIDPFMAVAGLQNMDFKAIRALLYSSLVAGQLAEDESKEFDLSINQVGRIIGSIMQTRNESFEQIFKYILDGVNAFFPEPKEEEEEEEEEEKNE